ncbi:hypothetical protein Tco_1005686 [Tanacetum coccineum]|uniref:Uncharacterized protein n=1 Tax=Tanacetum coccineum TaxID=301880 RepID=A0ABQ5FGH3_9ASTR
MEDPNITMEEYIRLQEEKALSPGETFDWQTATYGKMEYCENKDNSFTNLETEYPAIVFDDTSDITLSREPTIWDDEEALFTSHAWRRLFEVRGTLVREFILEFLSTCRMSDIEMGLDVADTLCFQLDRARRRMTWRKFILALGLHSKEEMAEAGFGAYLVWSERVIPDKGDLRDYWIGISSDKDFWGPLPLMFTSETMSLQLGILPVLIRLVSDEAMERFVKIIARELLVIDLHELAVVAGAPGAAEDAPVVDVGAEAVPAPV